MPPLATSKGCFPYSEGDRRSPYIRRWGSNANVGSWRSRGAPRDGALNHDWSESLCALIARRVRFVLMGGPPGGGPRRARLTENLDVFVD